MKKPFLQKSKPVNTGAPARFLSKKMGFFRGYLGAAMTGGVMPYIVPFVTTKRSSLARKKFLPRTRAPKNSPQE
ncbi:hypothetical protein DND36_30160 [Pseudomonas savastanoi pv. glycinea]|nr:hypothetical protein DND36_30160 [Pseudomonas savastanoi pv. glycinea]